ncbi:hypothetical protein ACFQZZ_14915 [Nocardia sp. GCM10030253]|uniref:hypothetical protein n=1 Tax=Nocardia sp. GCM10030253 TaxID=3273404 RepID=UPI003639DBB4
MSDNTNEPILPIPSDLYREMAGVYDRINQVRDALIRLREPYFDLEATPQSLAVDNLGEPTTPTKATAVVLGELLIASAYLDRVEAAIDRARQPANRLKLTDQADQHRERQLAEQRPRTERTR